jgi:hypothetical protein
VDVINDRNRYWGVSAWGHFGFSHLPAGRRYAEFLTKSLSRKTIGLEDLGRLAQNALYFHEGPTAPIPQEMEAWAHRMRVPAGIRKRGPWVVCLSGLISTSAVLNQFYLDRQGSLSIFHEALGLIVTGANAKRQPELATFCEQIGDQIFAMPESSHLRMSDEGDRLGLAYRRFFAELTATISGDGKVSLRWSISGKGRPPEDARLTLQLCLKAEASGRSGVVAEPREPLHGSKRTDPSLRDPSGPLPEGAVLETAGGGRFVLGEEPIELGPEALGAWIRHGGWQLSLPPAARLVWPVHPYNPYRNGPEPGLEHAVAALRVPLYLRERPGRYVRPEEQVILLTLETV